MMTRDDLVYVKQLTYIRAALAMTAPINETEFAYPSDRSDFQEINALLRSLEKRLSQQCQNRTTSDATGGVT